MTEETLATKVTKKFGGPSNCSAMIGQLISCISDYHSHYTQSPEIRTMVGFIAKGLQGNGYETALEAALANSPIITGVLEKITQGEHQFTTLSERAKLAVSQVKGIKKVPTAPPMDIALIEKAVLDTLTEQGITPGPSRKSAQRH